MTSRKAQDGTTPQGQTVHARLVAEIASGALPPGARLTETDLAQRLGVSRTPVREAIRRLEAEGLVVHLPRIGATIRQLDYAEIMELYEMRTVLESTAAHMAARAASDVEIGELQSINADMAAALTDGPRLYDLNRRFHLTLMDAAKNRFLTGAMRGIQKTLLILGPTTLGESERAEAAVREHDRILAALRARDATAAAAAMRDHLEQAHRLRLRQIRDRGIGD